MTSNTSSDDRISQDDESEADRMRDFYGVGEALYMTDADIGSYSMADYGINTLSEDSKN